MDIDALWNRYTRKRDEASRNELVVSYQPLVKRTAKRLWRGHPSVELEDLESYGNFGLIDAIERFEPERGFKFETFALKRIQGAIYDGIRAMDWVPRTVRSQTRQLENANSTFVRDYNRPGTDEELLEVLGWEEERLAKVRERMSTDNIMALDESLPGVDDQDRLTLADTISDGSYAPSSQFEIIELQDTLASALGQLSSKEKAVLALYYFERLKFSEIGDLFSVSESRICQIHMQAIEVVRKAMVES